MIALFTAAILLLTMTGCIDRDIVRRFEETYRVEKTFDEYCENNSAYILEAVMRSSRLQLYMEKDQDGSWSGSLSYYEWSEAVEKIPVSLDGEELVIHSTPEKRVPMSAILLYRHFNADKCDIDQAMFMSFDHPLEEVNGSYPTEELKAYAENLYTELFSCLVTFERKDDYFKALEQLKSFTYIRHMMYNSPHNDHLSFGFDGNGSDLWNPGYGMHEDISLLISEKTEN